MCPPIVPTRCRSCRLELGMGDGCPTCAKARVAAMVEEERLALEFGPEATLYAPSRPEPDWDGMGLL